VPMLNSQFENVATMDLYFFFMICAILLIT